MKVLHLISGGDTGGALTHIHLLLKHLSRDNRVRLVCFMHGIFSEGAKELGIPTTVIEKPLPAALGELRRMVREEGFELIHCHGSRGNLMGVLLKPFFDLPVVSTVHSDPKLDYLGRPLAGLVYGSLNGWALRRMDHWIGVSDSMRALLISRGFPAERVHALYNGVEFDPGPAPVPGERERLLAEAGLPAEEGTVLAGIGARLDPVKDVATLLRGFALAWRDHPNLRLLIAGDGQEREALEALAEELGIRAVTGFAGWQSDMRRFYRCIDINTLTSLSETFPYAVTEGARERLPVVSTRVGGLPKLVLHGKTGFLVEPGDAASLGHWLGVLAEDPSLRRRLGEALYEKAAAEFSAAATAREQLRIYQEILDRRRRRGQREGVVLCGAYGMRNAGDEAVLDAILGELRTIDPAMPVLVLSRDPANTRREHLVTAAHTFDVFRFHRAMSRSRLYLNGGGSLIQDVTSSRSLWYYLYTLHAAKRRGCRVMMYGCGVGPVNRPANRRLAGRVINRCVDAISLRDGKSAGTLAALGVRIPPVLAAEPALSLSPAPPAELDALMERLGLDPQGAYFCICVRRWPGVRERLACFAGAAEYVRRRWGLTPLLLSVNTRQDGETLEALRDLLPEGTAALVTGAMTVPETIGLLSRMRGVLSMRLHVLVFAAAGAVPLAGVSYDPKVSGFLEEIGEKNYLGFEALERPEQLFPMIDAACAADREALQAAAERLKELERRSVDTARRLYEGV